MLTVEQVKNNISNYRIENGIVIDKSNNQPVQEENKILEVKSSVLFYIEAKNDYDEILKRTHSGKMRVGLEHFLKTKMENFSVNNEVQEKGNFSSANKLVNEILNSNGHIHETWEGTNLKEGKYSFLLEPKKDYFISYLKLKFREKGLDIDDIEVSIDTSGFNHTGHSEVEINYKLKKYEKKSESRVETPKVEPQVQPKQPEEQQHLYQHPMANELNELERQKQIAKQNNDEVAYNYAQSNIEKIIKDNRAQVSPEQWDSMNIDERKSYIQTKMREAKILNDKEDFDFWNANLKQLDSQEPIIEKKEEQQYNTPQPTITSDSLDFSVMINQLKNQNMEISNEYKNMMSDGYIDDEELAILINRLKDLSDNAQVIKSMTTDKNQEMMIDSIIETIKKQNAKMTTMQKGIEETSHGFGM